MDGRRSILIVEDESDIRSILKEILSDEGFEVCEAKDGQEGLEHLRSRTFDMVISDIRMPKMDGLEFLQHSRGLHLTVPFVFLTAFNDSDNTAEALRLGAFDFIRKPFNHNHVVAVAYRALDAGHRMKLIKQEIAQLDEKSRTVIEKNEKLISLLRVDNNTKRA